MNAILIVMLIVLGVWGMLGKRNIVKKVIALSLTNAGVVTAFVYRSSLSGTVAPILAGESRDIVDPVPQALMLTAIVVGICLTSMALTIVYRLYGKYGTLDAREIDGLSKDDGE